jgi:hypothetical protein
MEVSGQLHAQAALCPGKRAPSTHWIGGWVGPRTGLDTVVKRNSKPPLRLEPTIIQPAVAQRYATELSRFRDMLS